MTKDDEGSVKVEMAGPKQGLLFRSAALVAAALLGALVTLVIVLGTQDDRTLEAIPGMAGDVDNPVMRLFDPTEPLMHSGQEATLDDAQAESGKTLYLPEGVPGLGTPEIWYSSVTEEVAVRYGTELVLSFDAWEKGQDPATEYEQQASDWKAGETTTIAGNPAWVISAGSHAENEPPVPVVHVSSGGWDITLFGQVSVDELVKVAESLAPAEGSGVVPGGSA